MAFETIYYDNLDSSRMYDNSICIIPILLKGKNALINVQAEFTTS